MYVPRSASQKSEKTKMLALFNTLPEEDKDLVIAMSDSLARKYCQRKNACHQPTALRYQGGCK